MNDRVVVFGPHPGGTRGFTTVSTNVARQLGRRGWRVTYVALERRPLRPAPADLDVVEVTDLDDLAPALTAAVGSRAELVCFGNIHHLAHVSEIVDRLDARSSVTIRAYVAIDHAPLGDEVQRLTELCDQVIPSTWFGRRALSMLAASADPIPHGVDTNVFLPLHGAMRSSVRAELGADDDRMLVGCFGRNSGHKRIDLALRAFAHVHGGTASRCRACGWLTVHELGIDGGPSVEADRCRACSSDALEPEAPRPMRMYLHTDTIDRRIWRQAGGSDLLQLTDRLGVSDAVHYADLARPDTGEPLGRLAHLMGACDVHVMLSEGAGWELTVLETAACGVANIVTDHAAPAEYARPFSRMVPAGHHLVDWRGVRAIADLDRAAMALCDLHDDPVTRHGLGATGRATALEYDWDRVGDMWDGRLRQGITA